MSEERTVPEIVLVRLSGAREGENISAKGDVIRIGSFPDGDVVFDGEDQNFVASVHAKISHSPDGFVLYDNEDEYATYHNDKRVDRAVLVSGDLLQFGTGGPRVRFEVVGAFAPAEETMVRRRPDPKWFQPGSGGGIAFRDVKEHELHGGRTTIGRDPGNDIVLPHPQVSLFHAEVRAEGSELVFFDLKSRNGSFLGRDLIDRRVLQAEDSIHVGPYLLAWSNGRFFVYDERKKAEVESLHLSHDVRGGRIRLLDDISLKIRPGELVGVLGPSGAGKSTLLGCLCGMKGAGEGIVRINRLDVSTNYEYLKRNIGLVPQDDIIHLQLTPQRTFEYVSQLRLPQDTTPEERESRIGKILSLLELSGRRELPIHRLSGGQRKRVSLGVELLTEPNLIFLDEPTAGLDPALESKMMVLFKELAQEGKTVVVTTHLMENVELFDKLIILVRGKMAFFGTPGEAKEYFGIEDLRNLFTELTYHSPAEWAGRYRESAAYRSHVAPLLEESETGRRGRMSALHTKMVRTRGTPGGMFDGFRQWIVLTRRYAEITFRDRKNLSILLLQAPIIALFIVLAMKNTPTVLFMLSLSALWFGTSNSAKEIVKELAIYRRERMVNLGIFPYVLSKVVVLFSLSIVQCSLLFWIVHFLRPVEGNLLTLFGAVLLSALVGLLCGLFISAMVDSTDKASSVVPLVLIPQVLFAGAFTPLLGAAAWVSMSMPSRWSYDLMKRIVMQTHREEIPPLVDFRDKDVAEKELRLIAAGSDVALEEIDRHVDSFTASRDRVESIWDMMDREVKRIGEHRERARSIQDRIRGEFGVIAGDQEAAREALERQKKIARILHGEIMQLRKALGSPPDRELLLKKVNSEWLTEKEGQVKEVVGAYKELHDIVLRFQDTRDRLEGHLAEIEDRAGEAEKSGNVFSLGKDRLEDEVSDLHVVVEKVLVLEERLKANGSRIRDVQDGLTENLREGRFVFLNEGDSLRRDVIVLGGFVVFFFVSILWLQGRRGKDS